MYLKKILYNNIGPLEHININMPFNDNKSPKPLLIVGKNGSGKSILLSNIVDSFYEFGGKAYSNVTKFDKLNSLYYKIISDTEIKYHKDSAFSYLKYEEDCDILEYFYNEGKMTKEEWKNKYDLELRNLKLDGENVKICTSSKESCKKLFENCVCCYFPANRMAKPEWQASSYYNGYNSKANLSEERVNGELLNPITVEPNFEENINWIIDVMLDSSALIDFENDNGSPKTYILDYYKPESSWFSCPVRNLIEQILTLILEKEVSLIYTNRNEGLDRIKLIGKDKNIVLHSLKAMSTGQFALFNIFITILRYADRYDIQNSLGFNNIKGVVVIDEIDLHLHNDLLYTALPKLLKLFEKIQFIISTHSPMFILGMNKIYGKDGFEIRELPNNSLICPEEFSEFSRAYNIFKDTAAYRKELNAIKCSDGYNPLIITEGPTDWMHIKHALNKLRKDDSLSNDIQIMLSKIDVTFLEFSTTGDNALQMGDGALINLCLNLSKLPSNRKYIFIADRDKQETISKLCDSGEYKCHGNNVYSLCIPNVDSRDFDEICIEHYYSHEDLTIKLKCNDGISRRIYESSEFDRDGVSNDKSVKVKDPSICEHKYHILDGACENKKVFVNDSSKFNDDEKALINLDTNLALSKMEFAKAICDNDKGFENVDVSNFIKLFEIIFNICEL